MVNKANPEYGGNERRIIVIILFGPTVSQNDIIGGWIGVHSINRVGWDLIKAYEEISYHQEKSNNNNRKGRKSNYGKPLVIPGHNRNKHWEYLYPIRDMVKWNCYPPLSTRMKKNNNNSRPELFVSRPSCQ